MKLPDKPTAKEFRDKRKEAGLSQSETAKMLGYTTGNIKNWERRWPAKAVKCKAAVWAYFCLCVEELHQVQDEEFMASTTLEFELEVLGDDVLTVKICDE